MGPQLPDSAAEEECAVRTVCVEMCAVINDEQMQSNGGFLVCTLGISEAY